MLEKIVLISLFFTSILLTACDFINPEEPIPAYIQVDSVSVISGAETGSNTHDINDIWVYVDNKLVGTYEIPFKVPVLPIGFQNIALEAGIRENGQGLFRKVYPFYTSFISDTTLGEAKTIIINPVYHYEDVEVPLLEDFESLGHRFEKTDASDTTLMIIADTLNPNEHWGQIVLDNNRTKADIRSSQLYNLSRTSKVYLEMDYYCEEELTIGLFAREYSAGTTIDVRYPIMTLYTTNEWKKVYINLTDQIAKTPQAFDYRLFFSVIKSEQTDGDIAEIYLDNIKILHY
jgi:hypothetical protein